MIGDPVDPTPLAWPEAWSEVARPGQARIERLIAWIRFAVTVGVVVVVVIPPRPTAYVAVATVAALGALVYGAVGLVIVHRLALPAGALGPAASRRFAASDTVLTLLLVGVTGAGESLLIGVAMLVTIEVAMRFTVRETIVLTGAVALGLAAVIILVPEPPLAPEVRIQAAMWWVGLIGWSAAMVSALAHLLLEEQRERARLEVQQEAERRELAREREQRCRLEELERDRKEFLQVLHHELRTPTASMEALSRAVVHGHAVDEERRLRMLDLIQSHANHLVGLLDELRTVATAGVNGTGSRADVSAAELVHLAAHAAGIDETRLEVTIAEPVSVVRVDGEKLRRVLINLLENAIRHSPDGAPVSVVLAVEDTEVVVSVRDHGPGVSSAQAQQMFDKFVSLGERRGTSGLGLWIVGELVKAMDGTVNAGEHPEGGLVVSIRLPADEVLVAPASEPERREEVRS